MMGWSVSYSQAAIKGKGQALSFLFAMCAHSTLSFQRQLIPQSSIPQGVLGCAQSFAAPVSRWDSALYIKLVFICLRSAFQSQSAYIIAFEPHTILLSRTIITPFNRLQDHCPESEVNSDKC